MPYSYRGEKYFVVSPEPACGKPSLWAIVGFHGQQPFCRTCSRPRNCDHVQLVRSAGEGGEVSACSPWLGTAAFEERLQQALDLDSGNYKLYCLSREALPTHPREEAELQACLEGAFTISPTPVPTLSKPSLFAAFSSRRTVSCSSSSAAVTRPSPCTCITATTGLCVIGFVVTMMFPAEELISAIIISSTRAARAKGVPFPTQCAPIMPEICPCGTSNWQQDAGRQSTVFLSMSAAPTTFVTTTCSSCGHTASVDGKEFGVLRISDEWASEFKYAAAPCKRKSLPALPLRWRHPVGLLGPSIFLPMHAVGLDVLYEWRKKTKKGIPFFTFWGDLMDVYDNHGHTAAQMAEWGSHAMRSRFEQATFDFMELQHLDHAAMFGCHHLEVRNCVCWWGIGVQERA